ncbi:MAG TPA: hypothetical protein VI653_14770 [Steroidobacteraceae bacterium]
MSDSEHDDDFEAYLRRRASGGPAGQAFPKGLEPPDPLQPPPELDRIIIGKAREAIQGAAPLPLYRAPKWALPVGLAATMVISFAVILELTLRTHQTAPAPEPPIDTEIVADAPLITNAPPPAMPAPEVRATEVNPHPARPDATARRPASRATTAARSNAAPKGNSAAKPVARLRLPAIPTDPWPPVAASNATSPTDSAQAQADEKARTRLARVEVAESRSRADGEWSGDAAPRISNAEPNPSAATPPRVAYAPARPPTTQTPNVVTLEEVIVTGPAPSHHPRNDHLDPATWVNEIEKLHSSGRTAEAQRQIKRFREAYPAYPLPTQAAAADARAQ